MFSLTNAILWPYSLNVFRKLKTGFDSLSSERMLPLCGIFYVRNLFALLFFWVGMLGSRKARRSLIRSVNPIYPPASVSRWWRFPKPFEQRSINNDNI